MSPMTPSRPLLAAAVLIGLFFLVAFCGKRPEAATDASSHSPASAADPIHVPLGLRADI